MALLTQIMLKRMATPNEIRILFAKFSRSFFSEFLPPKNLEECHDLIRRLKDENEALKVELLPRTLSECHDLIRRLAAEKEAVEARYEALYERFTQITFSQEVTPQERESAPQHQDHMLPSNSGLKDTLTRLKNYTLIILSLGVGFYLGWYMPLQ